MRQHPSIESPTPSAPVLNPKLRKALGGLEIRLEEELARYRRQKAGLSVAPTTIGVIRKPGPKVELPRDPALPNLPQPPNPFTLPLVEVETPTTPAAIAPDAPVDFDPRFTAWEDPQRATPGENPAEGIAVDPALDPAVELGSSLVTTEISDDDRFSLAGNAAELDDYLESSEELLKSLSTEQAQMQVEKGWLDSLVTPLGIGSLLMLLLSSAMLGYVIMNPSSLLALRHLLPTGSSPVAPAAGPTTAPEPAGPIANSPPLDTQEFVDLGLDNLTTLSTRPAPTVAPIGKLPTLKQPQPQATVTPSGTVLIPAQPTPIPNQLGSGITVLPAQPALRIPAGPPIPTRPMPAGPTYRAPRSSAKPASPRRNSAPAVTTSQPAPPPIIYTPQPPAALPKIDVAPASPWQAPSPASSQAPTPSTAATLGVRFSGDQQFEQVQKIAPSAVLRNTDQGAYIEVPPEAVQSLQDQGIPVESIPTR